MAINDIVFAPCERCKSRTRHEVLFEADGPKTPCIFDDETEIVEFVFKLTQCLGCELCVMIQYYYMMHGERDLGTTYYPPETTRQKPEWLSTFWPDDHAGEKFIDLIDEVYKALRNNQRRLAAMGIRALIESMMIDCVSDQGSFDKNISAFEEDGHISKRQAETLKHILEAGHGAMHRLHVLHANELQASLDIVEGIFAAIYVNQKRAEAISKRVPPRNVVR